MDFEERTGAQKRMIELGAAGGRGGIVTDAGFFALWDPAKFDEINDFDSWESEVFDKLEDHEDAGAIVAFHDADGAYQIAVRIGSPAAPARTLSSGRPIASAACATCTHG
jgi:hypothetical protein